MTVEARAASVREGRVFPALALVRRELISTLRGVVPFACLLVLLIGLLLFVSQAWPSTSHYLGAQDSFAARTLFGFFCLILLAAAALLMPGLGAATILSEHEGDTFDQLHLTLIRPAGIIFGKLVSSFGVFVLFVVASMPVLGALLFLPGLDVGQVAAAPVIIVAAAVTCTLLGMAAASRYRTGLRPMVLAYILMLMYMGLPFVGFVIIMELMDWHWLGPFIEGMFIWMSPLGAMAESMDGTPSPPALLTKSVLFSGVLSGLAFFVAWWGLRQPPKPERSPEEPAARLRLSPASGIVIAADVGSVVTFSDRSNPVWVREVKCLPQRHRRSFRRATRRATLAAAVVNAFLFVAAIEVNRVDSNWVAVCLAIHMGILSVFAPIYAASILTQERRYGNLDLLRTTLLGPVAIVGGKALGALTRAAPLYLGQVMGSFVLLVAAAGPEGSESLLRLFQGWVSLGVCFLVAISLGVLASAVSRRTIGAVILAYTLTAAAMVGLYVVADYIRVTYSPPQSFGVSMGGWYVVSFLSPVAAYCVTALAPYFPHVLFDYWLANVGVWTAFSVLVVLAAAAVFDWRARRGG